MKHLGDITKINGAEVPPVDVITGGSPCQDLSVAGKRAGNAIAIPFWRWLSGRIALEYWGCAEAPTMASLFDGIGGFLIAFGEFFTPVWASEIEEFPIAVTKKRFPED